MTLVDTIINAKHIIPVSLEQNILNEHSLVIRDGAILDILPSHDAKLKYSCVQEVDYDNHALLPGFVNTHTHTPMTLLRGLGDQLQLQDWLEKCIWPAEAALMSKEFIADGTKIGIAEMLLNGTTCFSEHYFMPNISAEVARALGVRAVIGIGMLDTLKDNHKNYELAQQLIPSADDLINFAYAPHSPYMLSDDSLKKIVDLCTDYPAPIHIHLNETAQEISNSIKEYNMTPTQRLERLGLLDHHVIAVHMVHVNDNDLSIIAQQNNCHIVTCPDSNQKLGSGICNIQRFLDANLNVAVGTDGPASNNDLTILEEARTAALLNKAINNNSSLSQAHEVLKMLTINGAKALGLDSIIGSLEAGKQADFLAFNVNTLNSYPRHDLISQIIFAGNSQQIDDVWVNGRQLVRNRLFTQMEYSELIATAQRWEEKTIKFL